MSSREVIKTVQEIINDHVEAAKWALEDQDADLVRYEASMIRSLHRYELACMVDEFEINLEVNNE